VKRAAPHWALSRPLQLYSTGTPSVARALYATTRVRHTSLFLTGPLTPPSPRSPPFEGYVRVASVAASFASAFDAPQRALLLYLLAFTCDELVRVLSHVVGVRACAELWTWLSSLLPTREVLTALPAGRPLRTQVQPVHGLRRRPGHGH
jgi:hypothetical protein